MSTTPTSVLASSEGGGEGEKDRHEQFYGFGEVFSAEEQRTLYVVGHLAAGFLTLLVAAPLTAVVEFEGHAESGGAGDGTVPTGPAKALGVVETATRGIVMVTALIDEPIPLGNVPMAWLRRLASLAGVLTKGGFTYEGWGRVSAASQRVEAIVDVVITVFALIPTVYGVVELASEPASPEKTMAVLDETGNLCEGAVAFLHLGVEFDEEPESKAVLIAVETLLIMTIGGLHIGQAMTALGSPREEET